MERTAPEIEYEGLRQVGLLFFLCIVALLLGARLCYLYLADVGRFPIHTVKVQASYQHITHQQLESTLSPFLSRSFFSLSANKLQTALSQMDWVDSAVVERVWPDTLKINLIEKKPLVFFGEALMTAEAEIFNGGIHEAHLDLPRLKGSIEQKKEILQVYQKLSKILYGHGLFMASLELRDNQAWELVLVNDVKIHLGKRDIEQRLSRFSKAYPALLAEKTEPLESVDLRYPRGMAVQWKNKREEHG